ncbi:MAG: OmpA family protein [Saprospiraceae bacterium]
MRFFVTALVCIFLAGSFQSCVSKKKYDELTAGKAATDQALAETQANLKNLEGERDALQNEFNTTRDKMNADMAAMRTDMTGKMDAMSTRLKTTEAELEAFRSEFSDMFSTYKAAGLSVEARDGDLYLATETPFTFRSGSSSLTREERDAIDAMASKLQGTNVRLMIEGHTDDRKFNNGSGRDNWDLSFARAKAVAARLIKGGVSAENVVVAGAGEYHPMMDNGTSEGRAANRRTVLKPNPKMGKIIDAMNADEDNDGM